MLQQKYIFFNFGLFDQLLGQKFSQINMYLKNRQVIYPVIGNCMTNTNNATKEQFNQFFGRMVNFCTKN
jgi:hypothetical protein